MRKLLVLLVAAAFVFTMALPAMAADKSVDLYGSVRVQTYILDADKENNGTAFDDSDLVWSLDDGSSRFGARFKAGDIGANVEIRPRARAANSTDGSQGLLRQWHATWNFGSGTLLVGQAYTPTFNPICNECLVGGGGVLDGYGDLGGSVRTAGLQVWFPVKGVNGMLKLAALDPQEDSTKITVAGFAPTTTWALNAAGVPTATVTNVATDTDYSLPQLEASLSMAFGSFDVLLRGGYKSYDAVDTTTNSDVSVDSYLLAINLGYSMGPFYAKTNFYTAQNMYTYSSGGAPQPNWVFAPRAFVGTDVEDVDNWGWFAVAGFKFSDKVSFEAGYGQKFAEQNQSGVKNEDETSALVFFLPITVAKGFTITPEILIADQGNRTVGGVEGADRGTKTYYGLYWRIDF